MGYDMQMEQLDCTAVERAIHEQQEAGWQYVDGRFVIKFVRQESSDVAEVNP